VERQLSVPLEEIGKIPLFRGITQHDLEELVKTAHRKRLKAGEFFFLQGDPAESMFVLLEDE